MGDFLASLFGGQNKTLNQGINNLGSLANFSTGVGEGATNAANNFYQGILSGDPSKISAVLAPAIKAQSQQIQQQKQNIGQFGNRSGGNTGAATALDSSGRGNITSLIGSLLPQAAQGEAGLGTQNLVLGSQNTQAMDAAAQQRMQNWLNSILGGGISSYIGGFLNPVGGG